MFGAACTFKGILSCDGGNNYSHHTEESSVCLLRSAGDKHDRSFPLEKIEEAERSLEKLRVEFENCEEVENGSDYSSSDSGDEYMGVKFS